MFRLSLEPNTSAALPNTLRTALGQETVHFDQEPVVFSASARGGKLQRPAKPLLLPLLLLLRRLQPVRFYFLLHPRQDSEMGLREEPCFVLSWGPGKRC
jgi:hypothetical protein